VALTAAACGGGGGGDELDEIQTPTEESEDKPDKPDEPIDDPMDEPMDEPDSAEGAVTDIAGSEAATVRIVAEGAFRPPGEASAFDFSGSGSGFIIDPSGLVVTNNHVVTGAATLQVYFSGDNDDPINARILGVSECSDLAVIDLEGDGYPYFQWYEGEYTPGFEVFAVGYPLGDSDFTVTNGVIGKPDTDIETTWASADRVIEHDSQIRPGNSGGPLLSADGQVVGVNYAGIEELSLNVAIRVDEVLQFLDELIAGNDVMSIGVNGQAVILADGLTGVWVANVASGSPADRLGIQAGDVITRMEGLTLAADGTMAAYCDILRTQGDDAVLSVEVVRFDTQQVFEGRLNTEETLVEAFSFVEELGDEVEPSSDTGGPGAGGYSGFVRVTDDDGIIEVEIPVEWVDIDSASPWIVRQDMVGPGLAAAADLQGFFLSFEEPGVFLGASPGLAMSNDELLDYVKDEQFSFAACTYDGRQSYSDPLYTGSYDYFFNCLDEDIIFISVAAMPDDGSFIVHVQIQVVTEADLEALDRILQTFIVNPPS